MMTIGVVVAKRALANALQRDSGIVIARRRERRCDLAPNADEATQAA
jgi:hypothetical protein